jgi:hypothetical protein
LNRDRLLDGWIQVTRFSDGGIALGVCQSHVVADGQSLWDFMVAWGEIARGPSSIISAPPIHDRTLLALEEPPSQDKADKYSAKFTWKGGEGRSEEEEEEADDDDDDDGLRDPKSGHEVRFPLTRSALVQCVLEVSGASVRELKAEAGGGYSAYEAVCAHFWRSVNRARRQGKSEARSRFFGLANLRNKRPREAPLPSAYFGNAIVLFLTNARADDLAAPDTSLGDVARRIHAAIGNELGSEASEAEAEGESGRGEAWACGIHWLELHGNSFRELLPLFVGFENMNVASSPRFPAYAVDFGWGRPAAVRSARVKDDGEMVLFGGRPGSAPADMEICIALPPPVMRRLLDDPAFLATPISDPFLYYGIDP